MCVVFFFKHYTAYEMRISDWISDVFSSDLVTAINLRPEIANLRIDLVDFPLGLLCHKIGYANVFDTEDGRIVLGICWKMHPNIEKNQAIDLSRSHQIGRASRQERVCTYV